MRHPLECGKGICAHLAAALEGGSRKHPTHDCHVVAALEGGRENQHAAADLAQGEFELDAQLVAAVTNWCAQQGVLADDIQTAARLEDVFFDLTDNA